ncbi:hypothetical protein FA411_27230, partial [Pseudomonas aeruginosa]|nr:hypothetical protein [Pseudomonas aeruginosa]
HRDLHSTSRRQRQMCIRDRWDTIVDSIRVRPTSSSPRGGNAGPSPAPKPATPGGQTLGDHYVYEEFLSSLKPKDSWLDDL